MSTPELVEQFADFSVHRRPSEEEHGMDATTYTVDAPRWYVAFGLVDETLELSNGMDILQWHVERATRQVVDAILDNPVVSREINRRYVAKEKVRRMLTWIQDRGMVTTSEAIRELEDLLKEEA